MFLVNAAEDSQHWSQHRCEQLQSGCPSSYRFWSPDRKKQTKNKKQNNKNPSANNHRHLYDKIFRDEQKDK